MRRIIFITVLVLLLGTGIYVYIFYYNAKSEGTCYGFLQTVTRTGNVLKTYEGDIVMQGFGQRTNGPNPGLASQQFYFSITDQSLADSLQRSCQGKMVEVHYLQYRRSLPWRGENYNGKTSFNPNGQNSDGNYGQYIVDKIVRVENLREMSY